MHVTLQYFGQLRQLAGQAEETVAPGLPVDTCLRQVAARHGPSFAAILFDDADRLRSSVMILLNDSPVDRRQPPDLHPGDTLALMSAIAGG